MTTVAAMGREVKGQLTSPVIWLVVGIFAVLAGAAFVANLNTFLDMSIEALSAPPARPVNVNQLLIRPFLVQVGLAALLVLPVMTARAHATSDPGGPRDAFRTAVSRFVGVFAVYAVMLAMSLALVVALFLYGAPEWGPIASGYLGLVLMGAAFIGVALFVSSLATSALPAAMATFAISLAIAASAWLARSAAPAAQPVFRRVSVGEALDDFAKGVIDTGHVVACLTILAVSLFLMLQTRQPDARTG
jgi:ABC-2 type transport system permease protein